MIATTQNIPWTVSLTKKFNQKALEQLQAATPQALIQYCLTNKVSPEKLVYILAELIGHGDTEIAEKMHKNAQICAKWRHEDAEQPGSLTHLSTLYITLN